ncbi:tyrosine-protein phosphatase [Streptomyces sp. NBC_01723]|uniref:tyrosine-protein phosphatase n=1 Tax=unclassified Streptomyces TaxID=2593676 RepID=UPI002E34C10E|nr:tyrosine-protein phosphatase [Streptomyces sp. NBC_01723]
MTNKTRVSMACVLSAAALLTGVATPAATAAPAALRAAYLNSGFAEVEDAYGSFAGYEEKALGMDARELRRLKADLLVG